MRKLLILLAFLFPQICFSADADNADAIKSMLENSNFNGAVLVARDGNVILKHVQGVADSIKGEMLDLNSGFELASISKVFTALSIHKLVEEDKISYNDSLFKFFPKLPYKTVTIAGLLSHTSGLFDVYEDQEMRKAFFKHYASTAKNPFKPYGNQDYLLFLEQFKPPLLGEAYEIDKYSNTGYLLLGLIIEKVSGQEYDDYIETHILKPADMNNTFVFSKMNAEEVPNFVKGHRIDDNGDINRAPVLDAPPRMRGETYGDDDMVSTLDDLLKFDKAISDGRYISPVTLVDALMPLPLKDRNKISHYGLGFAIDEAQQRRYVGHSGSTTGFITYMQFGISSDDHTIILLSNVRGTNMKLRELYLDIRNIVRN
ncbi:MAG: serine hydrolase [Emcibacteraceae bacterium]|nr:serine hydrolase [Emcibacteraceae bacterium]